MTGTDTPPVKATTTSARILESLMQHNGATLTVISDEVGLSKSSVHNHLETLDYLGFVVKEDQQYRVSLRFLQIGSYAREQFPIYGAGKTEIDRLAGASGLVTGLTVLEENQCISIHNTVGQKVDESPIRDGDVLPLHCTAPGKAMLAELPPEEVDTLLESQELDAFTEQTIIDRSELLDELDTIRSRRLALDREEWKTGLRAVAAGISNRDDQLLGAIFVMSPADSMSGKRFQQDIPGLVISSANQLRKNLHEAEKMSSE